MIILRPSCGTRWWVILQPIFSACACAFGTCVGLLGLRRRQEGRTARCTRRARAPPPRPAAASHRSWVSGVQSNATDTSSLGSSILSFFCVGTYLIILKGFGLNCAHISHCFARSCGRHTRPCAEARRRLRLRLPVVIVGCNRQQAAAEQRRRVKTRGKEPNMVFYCTTYWGNDARFKPSTLLRLQLQNQKQTGDTFFLRRPQAAGYVRVAACPCGERRGRAPSTRWWPTQAAAARPLPQQRPCSPARQRRPRRRPP